MRNVKSRLKKNHLGGDEVKEGYIYSKNGYLFHNIEELRKFSDIDDDFLAIDAPI